MAGSPPRSNECWVELDSGLPVPARSIVGLDRSHVSVPGLELFVACSGRMLVCRFTRRPLNPIFPVEKVPPHVDGEGGKERPLKDVQPTECVTSESSPQLESKGAETDKESSAQGEVEPESVFSCQANRTRIGTGRFAEVTRFHPQDGIATIAATSSRRHRSATDGW
jgi:hypothetical protein